MVYGHFVIQSRNVAAAKIGSKLILLNVSDAADGLCSGLILEAIVCLNNAKQCK